MTFEEAADHALSKNEQRRAKLIAKLNAAYNAYDRMCREGIGQPYYLEKCNMRDLVDECRRELGWGVP